MWSGSGWEFIALTWLQKVWHTSEFNFLYLRSSMTPPIFSRQGSLIGLSIANLSLNTEWRLTDPVQVPPPHPPNKFPGHGWLPPTDPSASYVNKYNSYVERVVAGGFRERVGVKVRHFGATRLSSVRSREGDEQRTPLGRLFESTVQPTSLIQKFTAHAHLEPPVKEAVRLTDVCWWWREAKSAACGLEIAFLLNEWNPTNLITKQCEAVYLWHRTHLYSLFYLSSFFPSGSFTGNSFRVMDGQIK